MKKPFDVGDRVRVYGHKAFEWEDTSALVIERGIAVTESPGFVMVLGDNGLRVLAHPKQCRRLVKKKKKWEWRYVGVSKCPDGDTMPSDLAAMCNEVVKLREEKSNWRTFAENQAKNWEASAEIVKKQNERIKDLELALSRYRFWGTDTCPSCQGGRVTLYALHPQLCVSCSGPGKVEIK